MLGSTDWYRRTGGFHDRVFVLKDVFVSSTPPNLRRIVKTGRALLRGARSQMAECGD